MSTPVFPVNLPKPSMRQYSMTPMSNVMRTEMESGPARTRRRYISVPTDVSVTWTLTLAELGTFQSFYRGDIFDGAGWFLMPVVMRWVAAKSRAKPGSSNPIKLRQLPTNTFGASRQPSK